MAASRGLTNFNLSLIRLLMRQQKLTVGKLASGIGVSKNHLSKVLNRHAPLSTKMGKGIAEVLGVSWEVIRRPETDNQLDLIRLALTEFLLNPVPLDWKNFVALADKMGILPQAVDDEIKKEDDDESENPLHSILKE